MRTLAHLFKKIKSLIILFLHHNVTIWSFQAEDGIRDSPEWLEFRRVLFRSLAHLFKKIKSLIILFIHHNVTIWSIPTPHIHHTLLIIKMPIKWEHMYIVCICIMWHVYQNKNVFYWWNITIIILGTSNLYFCLLFYFFYSSSHVYLRNENKQQK